MTYLDSVTTNLLHHSVKREPSSLVPRADEKRPLIMAPEFTCTGRVQDSSQSRADHKP